MADGAFPRPAAASSNPQMRRQICADSREQVICAPAQTIPWQAEIRRGSWTIARPPGAQKRALRPQSIAGGVNATSDARELLIFRNLWWAL
jgi:hypothetical protein